VCSALRGDWWSLPIANERGGREIWIELLGAVLLLMMLEMIVS
jgi:hypothetical protein